MKKLFTLATAICLQFTRKTTHPATAIILLKGPLNHHTTISKCKLSAYPGYTFGKISRDANNGCPEVPPGEVMRDGYKCNRDNAASGMELFNRVADDELRVWISRHYFDGIDANRYLMKMDTRCSA